MPWNVIIEHDPETDSYTATVAGLPDIVLDAHSEQQAVTMAQDAIRFYLEEAKTTGLHIPLQSPETRVVPVEI